MKTKIKDVDVIVKIDARAYASICAGFDPERAANIYYRVTLNKCVQDLLGKSVPRGVEKWKKGKYGELICTGCHLVGDRGELNESAWASPFCPNCGAKMEGAEE